MRNKAVKTNFLAVTLLLATLLFLAGCAADETINPNASVSGNGSGSGSGSGPVERFTYKPFASGHGNKFSLGDFDSPYLVRVGDDRFVLAGSQIILNNVTNEITKTDYQGGTYVGIASFGFNDYTNFISTNATLTIKVSLVASDGTYTLSNETVAMNLTVTKATNLYTWQDLQGMKHDLTADYSLRNDVNFPDKGNEGLGAAGFEPVGDNSAGNRFTGSFAGGGYGITNLSIDRERMNNVGIWGVVEDGNSVIKDFVLDHGGIVGTNNVGGVVGELRSGMVSNVGVLSSRNMRVSGNAEVGGLVGDNGGTVTRSYATTAVFGRGNDVGGLVGKNDRIVTNSYATGAVTGKNNVGGLVGDNDNNGIAVGYATGNVTGNNRIGGFVGENRRIMTTVVGYATGNVTGDNSVGGFVGWNNGRSVHGYARGAVSGDNSVGGLVGNNLGTVAGYATGKVPDFDAGGLVGNSNTSGTANGYWDQANTGDDTSNGGAGISAIANVVFASPSTYTDNKGTPDAADDVVVFDDATFLMHFDLPGVSATWPTLKAASFFLPLTP